MHNWANFCDITRFNLKNKDLVASLAARFFLNEASCKKLIGKTVYLVPPEIDVNRKFVIEDVRLLSSNKIEFSLKDFSNIEVDLTGKSLLLSNGDVKEVFESMYSNEDKNYIGKIVIDPDLGNIGKIKDIAGTSAQKHFIVEYDKREVLIPVSDDLIESETEEEIIMNLPKGILEINED